MQNTLIVLIGPTGVGKTELSLSIAEHFGTCIVSSDSRQLYADLKIGTAAPTPDQMARVPHYFVGTLKLTDYYSAAQYEAEVMAKLEELYQHNDVVVLTGGSMMYVDAICKGIDDIPTVDKETRELMMRRYEEEGLEKLDEFSVILLGCGLGLDKKSFDLFENVIAKIQNGQTPLIVDADGLNILAKNKIEDINELIGVVK